MLRPSIPTTGIDPLICQCPAFRRVLEDARRAARSNRTVIVTGESGSGKGRVARDIHSHSPRRMKPFVVWSAPQAQDTLALREMFGHVRGAYTGADRDSIGFIEAAHTGTLLIDDVDKMALTLQGLLLRFLDERAIQRLGSTVVIKVDLRLLVTTNRPLAPLVKKEQFLPDLAWRLSGLSIHVPPLRERPEDVCALVEHFAALFAQSHGLPVPAFNKEAVQTLMEEPWPGNVRQLAATIENLVFHANGADEIRSGDVVREIQRGLFGYSKNDGVDGHGKGPRDARLTLESLKRAMLMTRGNGLRAAEILGIPLRTFRRWLARYGLTRRNGRRPHVPRNLSGPGDDDAAPEERRIAGMDDTAVI